MCLWSGLSLLFKVENNQPNTTGSSELPLKNIKGIDVSFHFELFMKNFDGCVFELIEK